MCKQVNLEGKPGYMQASKSRREAWLGICKQEATVIIVGTLVGGWSS